MIIWPVLKTAPEMNFPLPQAGLDEYLRFDFKKGDVNYMWEYKKHEK
jgi:hypothetical protein